MFYIIQNRITINDSDNTAHVIIVLDTFARLLFLSGMGAAISRLNFYHGKTEKEQKMGQKQAF